MTRVMGKHLDYLALGVRSRKIFAELQLWARCPVRPGKQLVRALVVLLLCDLGQVNLCL